LVGNKHETCKFKYRLMYFETVQNGGCVSYVIGCEDTFTAAIVDPVKEKIDRYLALAATRGMNLRYAIDTHVHADHFSACRDLARSHGVSIVMHRTSPLPFVDIPVDDGETIIVGRLRFRILHTPGHTADSMCLVLDDRIFTGDTLLLGATGRTDLPTGDASQLYDSLFNKILKLDDSLVVYPAHNYNGSPNTTLREQRLTNPRLQRTELAEFIEQMETLNLRMPDHLTEALRTNRTGGQTVGQLIEEAARAISFMQLAEVRRRLELKDHSFVILDVREKGAYEAGHLPGALHLARGQLELRVDEMFPDPTVRILTYCQYGKISTLAAHTMRRMGYTRAVALDGGFQKWIDTGYPVET